VTPQPTQATAQPSPIAGSVLPLQKAEELIASLQDVVSVRITATETGSVEAIHVLVTGQTPPKAVVRNIESALMAQLGLRVDHRKISVAQTADVKPIAVVEREAVRKQALQRTLLFENLTVSPGNRPHRITITVSLSYGDRAEAAAEESSDTPRSRVEAAAKAAVSVLDRLLERHSLALEGAKIVEAFDREFAFVAVQGLGGRDTLMLTGSAEIKESAERAAVFAVLDATNRWTELRRPA